MELLRLNPDLQQQGYDELLSWLALRYQMIQLPPSEQAKWMANDTPDSYLVRVQKRAEYDLPPLPPKKIHAKNTKGELVTIDGKPVMVKNPEYHRQEELRKEF